MKIAQRIFAVPAAKQAWYKANLSLSSHSSRLPPAPKHPRTMIWGRAHRKKEQSLPKVIWSYWNGHPSRCAEACRRSWDAHCPDLDIRVLNRNLIGSFLPDFPDLPENLPEQKVSNLVRLMLLERYGGIWIDHSVALTKPIDWVARRIEEDGSEALAFYNEFREQYRSNPERPTIENGFLAACPGSEFIGNWRTAYQQCILSSNYKEYFRKLPNFDQLSSNFLERDNEYLDYFVCYFAAQQVMVDSTDYRLSLVNAEDDFYYHFFATSPPRNRRKFVEEILLRNCEPSDLPSLIKVNGWHRKLVDEHIRYGCYRLNSTLGRYINQQGE